MIISFAVHTLYILEFLDYSAILKGITFDVFMENSIQVLFL